MNGSVAIKGTKNGLTLVLDENEEWDALKEMVGKKFSDSAKFLGTAKTALAFEGRKLSEEQKEELIKIITENTELEIVCLIDPSDEANKVFKDAVDKKIADITSANVRIYKGNLRSGQCIEAETGVVVLGDINPGASVTSKGSVIVLGTLRGTVWAGTGGNRDAFVIATDMMPVQIRIGEIIARSPDRAEQTGIRETKVAYIDENGDICISPMTKDIINTLIF